MVSTHLESKSQIGSSPQVEIIVKTHWKHHQQGACSFKPQHFEPQNCDVLFQRQPTKKGVKFTSKQRPYFFGWHLLHTLRCVPLLPCQRPVPKNGAGHRGSCSELIPRKTNAGNPKMKVWKITFPLRVGDFSGFILIFLGNIEAQETYQASMKNKCILLWWVPAAPSKSQRLGLWHCAYMVERALSSAALETNFQHLLAGMVWLLLWFGWSSMSSFWTIWAFDRMPWLILTLETKAAIGSSKWALKKSKTWKNGGMFSFTIVCTSDDFCDEVASDCGLSRSWFMGKLEKRIYQSILGPWSCSKYLKPCGMSGFVENIFESFSGCSSLAFRSPALTSNCWMHMLFSRSFLGSKPSKGPIFHRSMIWERILPPKLTDPLKIDGWKMTFPFWMVPFEGTFVHFQEGRSIKAHVKPLTPPFWDQELPCISWIVVVFRSPGFQRSQKVFHTKMTNWYTTHP